jgi:hypothetical protein
MLQRTYSLDSSLVDLDHGNINQLNVVCIRNTETLLLFDIKTYY